MSNNGLLFYDIAGWVNHMSVNVKVHVLGNKFLYNVEKN